MSHNTQTCRELFVLFRKNAALILFDVTVESVRQILVYTQAKRVAQQGRKRINHLHLGLGGTSYFLKPQSKEKVALF